MSIEGTIVLSLIPADRGRKSCIICEFIRALL